MTADMLSLILLIIGVVLIAGSFSTVVVHFVELWKGLVE